MAEGTELNLIPETGEDGELGAVEEGDEGDEGKKSSGLEGTLERALEEDGDEII